MPGSHEDAVLMVELAKWGQMIGLSDALHVVFADEFDPDAIDARDPSVTTVLNFFETVGTLVKNGLFNRELVYDWLWVAGPWERVGPAAKRARLRAGVDALYENFEALAVGRS